MKKLKNIIYWLVFALPSLCTAQIDYARIILPDGVYSDVFEEKLVRLAWKNNPVSKMALDEVDIANFDYLAAKSRWTSIFLAQGNLNEFTINQLGQSNSGGTNTNQFFPRYNLSLNLPMSTIFELPRIKKAAKAKVEYSKDKVNQLKIEIRSTVFKLYTELKKNEQIRNLKKESLEVEESNLVYVQNRFNKSEVAYEDYVQAQRNRNELKVQLAMIESEYIKSKYDIEAIIGMKLEEVR